MNDLRSGIANLRWRALSAVALHCGLLFVLIGAMVITVAEAGSRFRRSRSPGAAAVATIAGAAGAVLLWHLIRAVRGAVEHRPRVVPYFREKRFRQATNRPASEESRRAFQSGYGIATDIDVLDDLARTLNVKPLSSFGFGDDLFGRRPQWTDIATGIETVSVLLHAVKENGSARRVSATTLDELQTLLEALTRAQEVQSSFALIVRYGEDNFISGVEMEKREGTFWT